jgi:glycosyltransferase involved in cell wall biosynthesis
MEKNNEHKKIHVTFVLPSLLSGGGIEMHTLKLLRHFNRERFHFSLVTLFERPLLPSLYKEIPQDVVVYRLDFTKASDIAQWKLLCGIFKKMHPDVVISSMFSANAIVRILKPFFTYKVITREHNTYEEKKMYHRIIDSLLAFFSDSILAVSSSVADFISKQAWISRNKIIVIHNGVDVGAIDSFVTEKGESEIRKVRNELRLQDDEKIILNVARLKTQKNHQLLIDGFGDFSKTYTKYHLAIVGDGVEYDRLKHYIHEKGLESKIHLLGYRDDVFAWYAASDFFVLTSKREGFPNVGVEAMAFGLPMISTHVPGVDEFLVDGQNGFCVESNPIDLATKMGYIASCANMVRLEMRETCKTTACRFSIKEIAKQYEEVIVSVYTL